MRLLKLFIFFCLLAAYSCKKDSDSVDFTPNFYFVNGGSSATSFARNLILFSSAETVTVNVFVSSTYLLPKTATVTLAVDDEYRTKYNAANGTNYQAMPATAYNFEKTFISGDNGTIYDTIPVTIQKSLLSGNNFLLPIKIISTTDGYKIDSATSVIYLHTNDNTLAGIYNSALIKKLYIGNASGGSLADSINDTISKSLIPLSKDTSLLDYADLGSNGWRYILTYDGNGGELKVDANNIIKSSIQPGSFEIKEVKYNPPSSDIYIKTRYKNLNGDERIVEETLTLQ